MKGIRKKIVVFAVAAAAIGIGGWFYRWHCIPEYEIIELGSLGGRTSKAFCVNNFGEVVGWADIPDDDGHAYIWDAKNGMRDLGTLGEKSSTSLGINDKGQVVGRAETDGDSQHAFFWDPNTGMTDLGTLGGKFGSEAGGINNRGEVFGHSKTANGAIHPFIWDANDGMKDVGTLGGRLTIVTDINANGQMVGFARIPNGKRHAFYRDESDGMTYIADPNGPSCEATGINDTGLVVGYVERPESKSHAMFLWTKKSGMKELNIPLIESSRPKINNSGQIIGRLRTRKFLFFGGKEFSFLRTRSGRIINLNRYTSSESDQIYVYGINDHGWIAGTLWKKKNDGARAILLRPK
ncbi:MAG: hypothetical protein ACYS8Z_15995 [Planctomycetota bacterium]|jgi:probable HAF family extracellular repeat protein